MRRLISLLAVLAVMAATLAATAAPAFAATTTIQCKDLNPFLTGVISVNTQTGQAHFNCKFNGF